MLCMEANKKQNCSLLTAKVQDLDPKIKYLISVFKAIKNQLPFPTPISIFNFQITPPSHRKSTTYESRNRTQLQILLPYLLPHRRFSRIFSIFSKNFQTKQNISWHILSIIYIRINLNTELLLTKWGYYLWGEYIYNV